MGYTVLTCSQVLDVPEIDTALDVLGISALRVPFNPPLSTHPSPLSTPPAPVSTLSSPLSTPPALSIHTPHIASPFTPQMLDAPKLETSLEVLGVSALHVPGHLATVSSDALRLSRIGEGPPTVPIIAHLLPPPPPPTAPHGRPQPYDTSSSRDCWMRISRASARPRPQPDTTTDYLPQPSPLAHWCALTTHRSLPQSPTASHNLPHPVLRQASAS